MALLRVEDLRVTLPGVPRPLVDGVSFEVSAGGSFGLVGASGSGKSLSLLSILGLPPPGARVTGHVWFDETDLAAEPEEALRRIRGRRIGFVFQEPLAALAPFLTIGAQLADVARCHLGLDRRVAAARAVELLRTVELADPVSTAGRYPHELSGGQRQRAAIALALAAEPALLLADEPTTAIDAVARAGILALLSRLGRERGLALVLVDHDLAVVASTCEMVGVVFAGRIVERGPTAAVLRAGLHPYTAALIAAGAGRGPRERPGWAAPGSSGCASDRARPAVRPSEIEDAVLAPAPLPGCAFRGVCPRAVIACAGPTLLVEQGGRAVACHRPLAHGEAA